MAMNVKVLWVLSYHIAQNEGGIWMDYIIYIQVLIDFVMKVLSYFKKNEKDEDDEPKGGKKK